MQDTKPRMIEPEPFTWVRYPLHRRASFGRSLEALARRSAGAPPTRVGARLPVVSDDASEEKAAPLYETASGVDPALVREARGKVFTEELRSVTDRVLSHPGPGKPEQQEETGSQGSADLRGIRWMRPPLAPHPDAIIRWLHSVYAGRVSLTTANASVNDFLLSAAGAHAFALLLPEADEFLYRVALQDGLDSTTSANLTFALNDPYLKKAMPGGVIRFREFDDDFFFKKRIGTLFFQTHELLLLLDLRPFGETGYLCFFYEREEQCDQAAVGGRFHAFLADLAPVLRRRRLGQESDTDLTRRLFRLMRKLTDGGKHPLSIVSMRVADVPEDVSGRHALRDAGEQIRSILAPAERIVLLPPDRMVILMSVTDEQLVIDRLHQGAAQSGYRIAVSMRRYPESGKNLLNYVRMP